MLKYKLSHFVLFVMFCSLYKLRQTSKTYVDEQENLSENLGDNLTFVFQCPIYKESKTFFQDEKYAKINIS